MSILVITYDLKAEKRTIFLKYISRKKKLLTYF